jgi:hypothetical protein
MDLVSKPFMKHILQSFPKYPLLTLILFRGGGFVIGGRGAKGANRPADSDRLEIKD